MKRLITIALAAVMCLSVASCGSKKKQVRHMIEFTYPTTVTDTIADCEYSITIDKEKYTLDDAIAVTVSLTNKGSDPVGLSAAMLDTVVFYVGGKAMPQYYNENYVPAPETTAPITDATGTGQTAEPVATGIAGSASDAATTAVDTAIPETSGTVTDAPDEFPRILEPGETVSVTKYFTPGAPVGDGAAADLSVEWRVRAKVEVCEKIPDGFPETEGEYEYRIIGVVVPH